ncbi:MAG TPA: AMP-binding protein, partial [Candidatus Polarisedimenticolia bacterium]|nr:AMP-binding protein [Candidatus Polarisedimenticolia bacterium]
MPIRTLCDILTGLANRPSKSDLLRYKVKGSWRDIPAGEFAATVRSLALGLDGLGVKRGEMVAILSENRPEWAAFDHALLNLGAIVVPIYPSLLSEQVRFILDHCGARGIVLSSEGQLAKVLPILGSLPNLARLIVLDPPSDMPTQALSWPALLREGEAVHQAEPQRFEALRRAVAPDDLASVLYTSGTTGEPKGVMLTHANLASVVSSTLEAIPIDERTTALSFLPLSHAFERVVQLACLEAGATIAFAESIEAVAQNLQEIEPTLLATVPRLLEKMHSRVGDALRAASPVRRLIFRVGMAAGLSKVRAREAGRRPPVWSALLSGEAER